MVVNSSQSILLPNTLRGRNIHSKIIPTVCNLKNMLNSFIESKGDSQKLKPWEKRSFQAYRIDEIKLDILTVSENDRIKLIKQHIMKGNPIDFGANCIDIYLVAYVAENIGIGKEIFFNYVYDNGISDKPNSAQAIWQVGKGDGVYLGILNENGSVKDWNFIAAWVKG